MNELTTQDKIDNLEATMLCSEDLVSSPVEHTFFPGLYRREIFMAAGIMIISKIHNTEHPYVILEGTARVYIPGGEVQELTAGYSGVTVPGTRRVLYITEDCRWVTFHPLSEGEEKCRSAGATEDELLGLIEERIIDKRGLPGSDRTAFDVFTEKLDEKETACLG